MDRVKGMVAIVTGGGSGIGKASALLLVEEGAKVVIADINEPYGEAVSDQIREEGGKVAFIKHDVSNEASWKELIHNTLHEFGNLDILVNNAGIMLNKSIEETSLEEWRNIMTCNLDGVFLGVKYAIEAMKCNGGGSIINISSAAALIGTLWNAAYATSKGVSIQPG